MLLVTVFTPLPPTVTLALRLAFLPLTTNAEGCCATRVSEARTGLGCLFYVSSDAA